MKKREAFGSFAYVFRFSGKTENKYRNQLDKWITETIQQDVELSKTQALNQVIKGLMNKFLGHSLESVNIDSGIDVETLKQGIIDDLKTWLTDTLASPEKAAHLAKVSQSAASGQSIEDDVINNILEDFGR